MKNFEKMLKDQLDFYSNLDKDGSLSDFGKGQLHHIKWCLEEIEKLQKGVKS